MKKKKEKPLFRKFTTTINAMSFYSGIIIAIVFLGLFIFMIFSTIKHNSFDILLVLIVLLFLIWSIALMLYGSNWNLFFKDKIIHRSLLTRRNNVIFLNEIEEIVLKIPYTTRSIAKSRYLYSSVMIYKTFIVSNTGKIFILYEGFYQNEKHSKTKKKVVNHKKIIETKKITKYFNTYLPNVTILNREEYCKLNRKSNKD